MDSSRIFIRNLPPAGIAEAELRKHFSSRGQDITDVRLIPRRRIGYVGFKTAQDAAEEVRYFNRSYIRMSRLTVELAKPVRAPTPTCQSGPRGHQLTVYSSLWTLR